MAQPPPDLLANLAAARAGSREALGEILESCRNYLLLIAEKELGPGLRAKGGASDLVQETFLDAQRDFDHFHGTCEEELLAWLRRLLANNLTNFARRFRGTGKRQIGREVPLDVGTATQPRGERFPGPTPTPGDQLIAQEQAQAVWQALDRLPPDYREVLLLRCRDGHSFDEIGRRTNRSRNAAQKLWARALERLHLDLEPGHESP